MRSDIFTGIPYSGDRRFVTDVFQFEAIPRIVKKLSIRIKSRF